MLAEEVFGRFEQWKTTPLFGILAVVVVPVEQRAGCSEADCSTYMPTSPAMSVSHALGSSDFDIMLISVHGTTP